MIDIVLLDDSSTDTEKLKNCLMNYAEQKKTEFRIHTCTQADEEFFAHSSEYSLAFFDVDMPGLNGIEAAKKLRETNQNISIVFVTNLFQYAIDGYQVDALDYILKPIEEASFQLKMDRIMSILRSKGMNSRITINTKDGTRIVQTHDIVFIEVQGHYLTFHLNNRTELTIRGKLSDYDENLSQYGFSRCNNCYLVNLDYIVSLQHNEIQTDYGVIMISKNRKKEFVDSLSRFIGGVSR